MLKITKIFRFEMAHAISGYPGKCKDIHGHSYELHVTVAPHHVAQHELIGGTGLVMDFKELKAIVNECVIHPLDHRLVLSKEFIKLHNPASYENLLAWDHEPSAENLILHIQRLLREKLPAHVRLARLKLFETHDSYAEWEA